LRPTQNLGRVLIPVSAERTVGGRNRPGGGASRVNRAAVGGAREPLEDVNRLRDEVPPRPHELPPRHRN